MEKIELTKKFTRVLSKTGITRADLFKNLQENIIYDKSEKITLYGFLLLISIFSYYTAFFNKDMLPQTITTILFIIGSMCIPLFFMAKIVVYLKHGKSMFDKDITLEEFNIYCNHAAKNNLPSSIYEKISPFFSKEEFDDILSVNITYEDLGFKDYALNNNF